MPCRGRRAGVAVSVGESVEHCAHRRRVNALTVVAHLDEGIVAITSGRNDYGSFRLDVSHLPAKRLYTCRTDIGCRG